MDAVEFLKAKVRMCENTHCEACGLHSGNIYCVTYCFVYPDEAVAAVEKWAKEHPVKTRQSEFLKVIPNAPMRIPGDVLDVCPNEVDATQSCPTSAKPSDQTLDICYLCKKAYWLAEVEYMRTTSDELLKKCGLLFITSTEAEELAGESPCMNCAREDCNLSGFFEIARKRLYIHAMLERKQEEYALLNVYTRALPFLVIDCKERIVPNECTAK